MTYSFRLEFIRLTLGSLKPFQELYPLIIDYEIMSCVFTIPLGVYVDTKNRGRTMLFGVYVNVSIENMDVNAMNHYIG